MAQFSLTRKPDASWSGSLTANGQTVEASGDGPHGLTLALARSWLAANGITATGDDVESTVAPPLAKHPAPKPPPPAVKPAAPKPK